MSYFKLESLDALHDFANESVKRSDYQSGLTLDLEYFIHRIEAEISDRYMALPLDANGETIHENDRIFPVSDPRDTHIVWFVSNTQIAFLADGGIKWLNSYEVMIYKPRTVEDVKRDLDNLYYDHHSLSEQENAFGKLVDEFRDLIGGAE